MKMNYDKKFLKEYNNTVKLLNETINELKTPILEKDRIKMIDWYKGQLTAMETAIEMEKTEIENLLKKAQLQAKQNKKMNIQDYNQFGTICGLKFTLKFKD